MPSRHVGDISNNVTKTLTTALVQRWTVAAVQGQDLGQSVYQPPCPPPTCLQPPTTPPVVDPKLENSGASSGSCTLESDAPFRLGSNHICLNATVPS